MQKDPGAVIELFAEFISHARAVRRLGSAALDLCYVAAGRFEGFWERRLQPWDVAARRAHRGRSRRDGHGDVRRRLRFTRGQRAGDQRPDPRRDARDDRAADGRQSADPTRCLRLTPINDMTSSGSAVVHAESAANSANFVALSRNATTGILRAQLQAHAGPARPDWPTETLMIKRQLLKSAKAPGPHRSYCGRCCRRVHTGECAGRTGFPCRFAQLVGFNVGGFLLKGVDEPRSRRRPACEPAPISTFEIKDFNNVDLWRRMALRVRQLLRDRCWRRLLPEDRPHRLSRLRERQRRRIAQDLKLQIVPITGTVRFLPVGRGAAVEPYIGGGIGFFNWRYSEAGEFVDFSDDTIFRDVYTADGTAVGPVIVAGLRIPIGDAFTAGVDTAGRTPTGTPSPRRAGSLADKIDLGGNTSSSRCTSASDRQGGVASIERYAATLRHPRESLQEIALLLRRAERRRRRLRPVPRLPPTAQNSPGRIPSPTSTRRRCPRAGSHGC